MENEMRFLAISVCALALIPAASNAQQATQKITKGPTLQAAAVGFRVNDAKVGASTKVTAAPIVRRHQGQDVALMAVGVGAMIAGALIDNNTASTIIIIGGAAMALFGLYHYLE
jgi:orotidine-5'-phosphate decarboxylase